MKDLMVQDRRVTRTRRLLRDALRELMKEQRYDSITVQNILDRADVGRATFYAHYRDKEELLISGLDDIIHTLILTLEDAREIGDPQRLLSTEPLFRHALEEYELHKAILGSQGVHLMIQKIQKHLARHIEDQLAEILQPGQNTSVPIPLMAHHVAGAALALLRWWFDNNKPYTAKEMDKMFQQLVMPGIWASLDRIPGKV